MACSRVAPSTWSMKSSMCFSLTSESSVAAAAAPSGSELREQHGGQCAGACHTIDLGESGHIVISFSISLVLELCSLGLELLLDGSVLILDGSLSKEDVATRGLGR